MNFETGYFSKRIRMNILALLALIYPDEPKYLTELGEVIWGRLRRIHLGAAPSPMKPGTTAPSSTCFPLKRALPSARSGSFWATVWAPAPPQNRRGN